MARDRDITREREDIVIDNAHSRAISIIERDAIDLQRFVTPDNTKDIARDMEYVRRKQEYFALEPDDGSRKYATVLEAIILDGISNSGWFGQSTKARKTSLYDDFHGGIDLVLTFKEDPLSSHTGLAIDVTFANAAIVSGKINEVIEKIRKGELAKIKYFETENYRGTLENIPRVVIGVDRKHLVSLARMWIDPAERKNLAVHPAQRVLLREGMCQLEYFASVARKAGRDEFVHIFEQNADILRRIARHKGTQGINTEDYDEDGVLVTIKRVSGSK